MPRKTFRYWALAHRAHDRLWSLVICLKPGSKQGEAKAFYERGVGGRRAVRFEFDVVKVWELEADALLREAKPGLLPLVPYAGGTSTGHVERALDTLAKIEPEHRRAELQAALTVFADNVFPDVDWGARMPEELLMGSTIYQRGEAAGQRKTLARLLTKRVGAAAAALVARLQFANEAALDAVADLLAEQLTDQELVTRLDEALPRAAANGEGAVK